VNRTQDDDLVSRSPVPIRRAHLADREAIRTFFAGLSARTRYLRFFAALTMTPAMLRVLSGGDNADAVVATGQGVIIGHGIAADRVGPGGTTITEIGVVVADASQGRGVGSALVRALISAAQARGAAIVAMEVLPGNQRVLAMIASHWPAASIDRSADCVIIRAQLPRPPQARVGHAFCSAIYGDDLGPDEAAVVDMQEAECAVRLAATIGRGPGIEDADAVGSQVERYVGMPEQDQLRGRELAA
jgi:ribosomal protein S18 acetylase RimI-like enzyme